MPRRATRAEREQRLAELSELLASRAPRRSVVRFARERWGLGERAAQQYVVAALERLRESAEVDSRAELGLAIAGYELIMRRQLSAGDLRSARATLDRLVALLGLARLTREKPLSLEAFEADLVRLETDLNALEEQTP